MANQLKMATIQTILSLRAQRWSFRRIARELGVHRETVARYVRQSESKPAKAPLGSDETTSTGQPPADPPPLGRSVCESWREAILAKLAAGLSAQRIHQDLMAEHGFGGSYYSVKRFVRKLGASTPVPFRRMECEPGQEAQVDFGSGAPIVGADHPSGGARKRRKTHLFRIVLSHSRKAYGEVTLRQTTEDFLRALENAFWHLGGVPKTVVIDNLKAAVAHPDWFDPELNPKLLSFARHYGTVILPTKPRTPRHKGKTERGVGYAPGATAGLSSSDLRGISLVIELTGKCPIVNAIDFVVMMDSFSDGIVRSSCRKGIAQEHCWAEPAVAPEGRTPTSTMSAPPGSTWPTRSSTPPCSTPTAGPPICPTMTCSRDYWPLNLERAKQS